MELFWNFSFNLPTRKTSRSAYWPLSRLLHLDALPAVSLTLDLHQSQWTAEPLDLLVIFSPLPKDRQNWKVDPRPKGLEWELLHWGNQVGSPGLPESGTLLTPLYLPRPPEWLKGCLAHFRPLSADAPHWRDNRDILAWSHRYHELSTWESMGGDFSIPGLRCL